MRKIVVNGVDNPKTVHTLKAIHYLAKHEKIAEFTVVQENEHPNVEHDNGRKWHRA